MKDFLKLFDQLSHRHEQSQVFSDFLEATVCAFCFGRQEDVYLDIMRRYDKDEIQLFGKLLGALISAYGMTEDGSWDDPLGHFFEEHANGKWSRERNAQFFTPVHVCDLMAQLTEPRGGSVCDPCCGSGRNLIAVDRLDAMNRFRNFYTAMDVDRRCVNMTVINFVMYGMPGVVIHMNTLSLEIYKGYRVYLPETAMGVLPLTKEQCAQYVISPPDKVEEPATPNPSQLTLFNADRVEEPAAIYLTQKSVA